MGISRLGAWDYADASSDISCLDIVVFFFFL